MKDYLVVKSNKLLNATSKYKYSTNELKIIAHLIANIQPRDESFEINEINVKTFFKDSNINTKYIDELTDNLLSKPFYIIENDKKVKFNWFSDFVYNDSIIEYRFSERLRPYLLDLKNNFTPYYLSNVIKLKSSYSIQLYELLKQLEDKGHRSFLIDDFRELLHIPQKSTNGHIKSDILEKAKRDLRENTDLAFAYTFEKRGRSYHKINFTIFKNKGK